MEVRALTPLRHDGVDYPPGALLAVDDHAGAALLAAGAADLVADRAPDPAPDPKPRGK